MMKTKRQLLWVLLTVLVGASAVTAGERLKQNITGSIKGDVYTSPEKDFSVKVPVRENLGGAVRDESGKKGDTSITQVIFTDDFGAFYRIVSIQSDMTMDSVLNVFHDVRSKESINGDHGREWRVIDVEKEGSEISVTSFTPNSGAQTKRPDQVTANAVFEANHRIYHVIAGTPVIAMQTEEGATKRAREDLAKFLKDLKIMDQPRHAD